MKKYTWQSGLNDGKSDLSSRPAQPPISCPECGGSRVWKDGLRVTGAGVIQRYLCRSCGFRFSKSTADNQVKVHVAREGFEQSDPGKDLSEANISQGDFSFLPFADDLSFQRGENVGSQGSSKVTITEKRLNTFRDYNSDCRVCETEAEGSKNLDAAKPQIEKAGLRETTISSGSLLFNFAWYLKKNGYRESTIKGQTKLLRTLSKRGAELHDPESVKEAIARQSWSEGRKENAVNAYSNFLRMTEGKWERPIYRRIEKMPWVPTDQEVDQLIAGSSDVWHLCYSS